MSDSCFYIGTRSKMLEVRAPSVNMPSSKQGYFSKVDFLNGGSSVRRSVAAHKNYTMTWNLIDRDEARVILDLADGVYGNGPYYIHDPMAADRNVLPQWWATPSQGLYDGLPLNGDLRGEGIVTPGNDLGFPAESVRYEVVSGFTRKVWVPIPRGYTAHVGAFGAAGTGGTVVATPTINALVSDTPVTLDLMSVNDDSRFNQTFSSDVYDGVELSLGGSGVVVLSGIMVQVLKTGVTPETGGFISGQGNSGLQFVSQPTYTPYSAALDKVGVVAELAEYYGWTR
jgi:hypothetical protein